MLRFALIGLAFFWVASAHATEAGWALLRDGGHVVLLSHAYATGVIDPATIDLEKCSTQRNLSDRGTQQARKMGALFAARAAETERVLSSRYCRCIDTAEIAFRDEPETLDALDLPPADETAAAEQKAAILKQVADFNGSGNLILVTHPATIKAVAGVNAREGEAVIVGAEGEGLHVLGRIVFN